MSEAEENLVAWMRDQKMHDSASLVERLTAERDELRAELAAAIRERDAERRGVEHYKGDGQLVYDELLRTRAELAAERESAEQYKRSLTDLHKLHCDAVAERDELRARLEALEEALLPEIDATLNKGDGDE